MGKTKHSRRGGDPEDSQASAYLAAIVESSNDAIISKDLNGVVTACNAAAIKLFGYRPEELIGQSVRILIPPDRQREEDEILAKIRNGERVDHFETVRLAKDGRPIDISLTVSPVRDAAGVIIGVSKTARDITERKRTAAELAEQHKWFRVTLASIGDGIIASDPDGRVIYMNGVAESLTGWTTAAAKGQPLADVFHIINETSRQRVENPAAKVIRHGRILGLANHTVLVSRDGTERPITDSAAPISDDAGAVLGVVLVFRDFTLQRHADEALAEQREWLETTLRSIGDAVIATDERGHVVFMNPVAEHLTGWRVDQARDRPCSDVFHVINENTRQPVENPVSRVLKEGVVVGLANHTVLIAAGGEECPIDDSGAPIRNRDGQIVGVVLVFRDVSDRRRAEAEREAAGYERERLLIAERMARAEAERANRLKDDFVAMVSHELRTPLNAILGWTDLMLRNPEDQALAGRALDVIARNTRLQSQLISDLLDISRIVSGKLRLEIQRVDLSAVIDDAIETVQHAADAKQIRLDRHIDPSFGPVAADPARLQQVVWNLLSNAVKFTPRQGHIQVTLRKTGSQAEIIVEDNGAGIHADFVPHVFDRFQQADASRTRRFGGLGLGLSIVKSLVEFHGGGVLAESEGEGKGAKFTITLPLAALPDLQGALALAAPAEASTRDVSLAGISVLLVEDESDAAEFVKRLLEKHGAQVTTAASAPEALELLATGRPDILISDIGLPEMDGYQLIERIRQKGAGKREAIPAVALTAFARSEDRTRTMRAGYQAHLAKPIESTELVATVASFAELVRSRRSDSAKL
jgi:PAS domain S-box-containing protein